MALEASLLAA
jgi:hypothetical protein